MFRFQKTFSVFTPGEAERITGVSVALQRDWRRRGILPKNDGFARFELPALLDMHTLKMLSDAGLGIEGARKWVPFIPARIAAEALCCDGAIEGDNYPFSESHRELVAMQIATSISRVVAGGDLIIWADGKAETVSNAPSEIGKAPTDKTAGVVRVLLFEAIGIEFARRAGRALVHIERIESD